MIRTVARFCLCLLLVLVLVGCASRPVEVRALDRATPFKEASTLKGAAETNGIVLGAEVSHKKTQKHLFTAKMTSYGHLPVLVAVTNSSKDRVAVIAPHVVLCIGDREVHPSPLAEVIEDLQDRFEFRAALPIIFSLGTVLLQGKYYNAIEERDEALALNVYRRALHERIVEPGRTVIGYVFFPGKSVPREARRILRVPCKRVDSLEAFPVDAAVFDEER